MACQADVAVDGGTQHVIPRIATSSNEPMAFGVRIVSVEYMPNMLQWGTKQARTNGTVPAKGMKVPMGQLNNWIKCKRQGEG